MWRKMCANLCCFFSYTAFVCKKHPLSYHFNHIPLFCWCVLHEFFFPTQRYTIWIFEYAYRCAEKIQTDSGYVGTKVNKPMELCLYRWCFQRFNRMLNLNTDIILIRLDLHFNRVFFLKVRIKIHSHVNRINSMLEPNFGHELDLF